MNVYVWGTKEVNTSYKRRSSKEVKHEIERFEWSEFVLAWLFFSKLEIVEFSCGVFWMHGEYAILLVLAWLVCILYLYRVSLVAHCCSVETTHTCRSGTRSRDAMWT